LVKETVPTQGMGGDRKGSGDWGLGRPPKSMQGPTTFRHASWSQRKTRREGSEQSAPHLKKKHPFHRQMDPTFAWGPAATAHLRNRICERVNHELIDGTSYVQFLPSRTSPGRGKSGEQENGMTLIPFEERPTSPTGGTRIHAGTRFSVRNVGRIGERVKHMVPKSYRRTNNGKIKKSRRRRRGTFLLSLGGPAHVWTQLSLSFLEMQSVLKGLTDPMAEVKSWIANLLSQE
jgi:hypothetical protein